MGETIDARGKACPQPVVMTKDALASLEDGSLTVLVDNPASCENVERFAKSMGCHVKAEKRGEGYALNIMKRRPGGSRGDVKAHETEARSLKESRVVVYIGADQMGLGEEELGRLLIRAFLRTLREVAPKPHALIFANSGVKLTTEGSDAIDSIKDLEALDIAVLSCGTCLDYLHLKDKLTVGRVSNMFEIASMLLEADKIVRP